MAPTLTGDPRSRGPRENGSQYRPAQRAQACTGRFRDLDQSVQRQGLAGACDGGTRTHGHLNYWFQRTLPSTGRNHLGYPPGHQLRHCQGHVGPHDSSFIANPVGKLVRRGQCVPPSMADFRQDLIAGAWMAARVFDGSAVVSIHCVDSHRLEKGFPGGCTHVGNAGIAQAQPRSGKRFERCGIRGQPGRAPGRVLPGAGGPTAMTCSNGFEQQSGRQCHGGSGKRPPLLAGLEIAECAGLHLANVRRQRVRGDHGFCCCGVQEDGLVLGHFLLHELQ